MQTTPYLVLIDWDHDEPIALLKNGLSLVDCFTQSIPVYTFVTLALLLRS